MKKYKIFLFVLVITALILTACGGQATQAPEEPKETEAAAEQPAEQPAEGEQVKLVFWSMWNEPEPQAQVIAGWIKDFEAQYPNITIEVVWNGRENQTKARTALSSGTQIDLVDQDSDQIAGGMMKEGMGYPLDEFLNDTALDEDVPIKDVFYPGTLETFQMDGKTYLWNYISNPVMWWYNKDILTEVGVEVPTTWSEFLDVNQKILDAGYAPIAMEGDTFDYTMFLYNYYVERLMGKGFLLSAIEDKTGESWKDPAFTDAMKAMRELWDKGYIPAESEGYVWPAAQQSLALGDSAMEICGGWLPTELRDTAGEDFKWGGFRMPAVEGGKGDIDDFHTWMLAFMILKDSQHPKEAFEFLKFISTKENMTKMADEALVGVTRKGVDWAPQIADGKKASEEAKQGILHVDGGYAFYADFVTNVLNQPFMDAFFGRISPEEFGTTMADAAAKYWANK